MLGYKKLIVLRGVNLWIGIGVKMRRTKMKKLVLFITLLISGSGLNAQMRMLDSLIMDFNSAKHDTTRANVYVQFSEILYLSKPDTVIPLCEKAMALCDKNIPKANGIEKRTFLLIKSSALNNIGYIFQNHGEIKQALDYYHRGLKIQEEIGDKKGLAQSLNNIGFIYQGEKDAAQALDYYKKSLKIREEIKDKRGIGECLNNIGFLYRILGDPNCKSQIEEACKKEGLNKGIIFYQKSLKIKEEIKDSLGIAVSLNNIGGIYLRLDELDTAMSYYQRSLKIRERLNDKQGLTNAMSNISLIYFKKKNYKEAEKLAEQSLKISQELGFPLMIQTAADMLKRIYEATGNYKKAMEMYSLFIVMKDSLNSQIAQKAAVKKQLQYEYEIKVAADSLRASDEKKIMNVQLDHVRTQRYALIGGILLVLIFATFMYNRFKITQKQKKLIEIKERETQQQKILIEDKQKEIVDSINYAQRIQRALLASDTLLETNLPEHFVLYKPKAIVSGDFYWATAVNNKFYLAVCDSTGHGVPGAFMSLLNISFLNEAVNERKINDPAEILNHARQRIIQNLSSDGGKDGMDCSFAAFDFKNKKMTYAAANNEIWVVRNGKLIELEIDKMPVGKHDKDNQSFVQHDIDLKSGDMIYLFTDGYADQFGGPKGKKFMNKQLQELFLTVSSSTAIEQKNKLTSVFEDWKGNLEQVDDVCIIGVRI